MLLHASMVTVNFTANDAGGDSTSAAAKLPAELQGLSDDALDKVPDCAMLT